MTDDKIASAAGDEGNRCSNCEMHLGDCMCDWRDALALPEVMALAKTLRESRAFLLAMGMHAFVNENAATLEVIKQLRGKIEEALSSYDALTRTGQR